MELALSYQFRFTVEWKC